MKKKILVIVALCVGTHLSAGWAQSKLDKYKQTQERKKEAKGQPKKANDWAARRAKKTHQRRAELKRLQAEKSEGKTGLCNRKRQE